MKQFDVIVVGTGAGNIVSDAALDAGLNVAVVTITLVGIQPRFKHVPPKRWRSPMT